MPFADEILTVTDLNAQVKDLLEQAFPAVSVLGEVSNFKRHSSGHLYFTLKDAASQLRAVCFRGSAVKLALEFEDGLKIVASGRLTVYEPYGQYQLVVETARAVGVGELEVAFRALCDKLEKEGLFDPGRKQPLPEFPGHIAVVTSPTGAAVQDIFSTLKRRWPALEITLFPVHVQGTQAAPEIIRAFEHIKRLGGIDLVIVGRGGGSLEDLWAFNEESLARAVFDCPVPVISAVGHETDFTICDFVADQRAATPTMAAEIAVPLRDAVAAALSGAMERLGQTMDNRLQLAAGHLRELLRSYALGRIRSRIEAAMQSLDHRLDTLHRDIIDAGRRRRSALSEISARLEALDPRAILSRGYTICSDIASGAVIRSAPAAARLAEMRVSFFDGSVRAEIKERLDGQT